ncbi:ATP-binding protein [Variovorax sp. RCC_210]|uniref:ATP-binding protein n=1 Tax=Variovorax sp. RCC_210 TaxID=3239217 RepID=UPI003524006D
MTFHRPQLAAEMAEQLLRPRGLMKTVRSGLFLGGQRRIGKTTFLRSDLIPALEAQGAIVVYVDLWSNTAAKPSDLLLAAVRNTLADLQRADSKAVGVLKRLKGLDLGAAGFKFGFSLADLGKDEGNTLAGAFSELVRLAKTDVVVIIDEVQHAMGSDDGEHMLLALKAARDAINLIPDPHGYFLFLGTGSHRARVRELTIQGKQAFNGATSQDFPVLQIDFVEWLLKEAELGARTPSVGATFECFERLGRRPEELMKALVALVQAPNFTDADQDIRAITEGVRQSAAALDLARLDELGPVALAVFGYVCTQGGQGVKRLFSSATLDHYGAEVGRAVGVEEIQKIANYLVHANILVRDGHGIYGVSDPFVAEAYNNRANVLRTLDGPRATK